jgi:MFS family permease
LPDRASSPRTAGGAQALALILSLTLPITPLLSLAPNIPQLFAHFAGVPHADYLVPWIVTMPSACIFLLSPMAGAVADRFGRRRMLVIASVVFTVFALLPLWLESIYAVLASMFVVGAAEAFIMSCGQALLGDYFPPEPRKRWLGVQGVLGSILATCIVMTGGALGNLGWHYPFLVNLLGAVVFAALLLFTWEPQVDAAADRRPAASAAAAAGPAAHGFPWARLWPIYAVTFISGIFYFFQIQMSVFFAKLGVDTPFLLALTTTIASVGVIAGGWYFRQQKGRSVAFNIALIFAAYAIGFIGIGTAGNYWVALVFAVIAQFGNGLFVPTFVGWALGTIDVRHRGFGMGVWTSSFFIGQFLSGPLLIAIAHARGGDMLAAIFMAGVACMVPLAFAALRAQRGGPPATAH